ncbi:unnamed protein product [Gemmataceae bacterium]|jgi:hypothetical protein|nr:unnamed protein product [Gemmataceae bacterium]VTT96379.1 unnamed protein product [Gemmataceae bacterium]
MAGKSPTEAVRDLQIELNKLISHVDGIKDEIRRASLLEIRERLTKLEPTLETLDIPAVLVQLGVLQEQIAELKKWRDESARRVFQVGLLFGGSLLTLGIQLAVLFLKK